MIQWIYGENKILDIFDFFQRVSTRGVESKRVANFFGVLFFYKTSARWKFYDNFFRSYFKYNCKFNVHLQMEFSNVL